jgi:hypothetical protein
MKNVGTIVILLLAAMLFGCKDAAKPKTEAYVESASEAARNDSRASAARLAEQKAATDDAFEKGRARDERQRNIDALRAVGARWGEGLNETSRTGRSDLAAPIQKLQQIKSDAETVTVDECTGKARTSLVASMSAAIAAYGMFQKETGDASDTSKLQLEAAGKLLSTSQQELAACQLPS